MNDNYTYNLPKDYCPYCGKMNDAATATDGKGKPEEGDITVCIACANHCIYAADLSMQKLTVQQNIDLVNKPEIWNMILKVKSAIMQSALYKKNHSGFV